MSRLFALAILSLMCFACVSAQSATPTPQDCTEIKAQASRLEARLKDWPQLTRYREADKSLSPPNKDEDRVVFLGDSITDGWSNPKNGGFFPGKPYINRGISGQTTPQMLIRFRPDVIALKPKVVVILAGTNDIGGNTGPTTLDAIEFNLTSMAELAHINGIRVVFASVLPINDSGKDKQGGPIVRSTQRPPEQIKSLNEWMKAYASANHETYLDYYSAVIDDKGFLRAELSGDGLHPNEKGYAIMSPLAEQAIATALKRK